jgi:cytoplasmic tRNA 2-thiolation protein 2
MCSIGEDDFEDLGGVHAMVADNKDEKLPDDEICKKCNKDKTVVKLSFKVAQCKNCFILYVRHKFRAAIGSTKIVKRDSNV